MEPIPQDSSPPPPVRSAAAQRVAERLAPSGPGGPLSHEQIQQISHAKKQLAPILKSQKVAQRTAGGLISGGLLTLLFAFMGGFSITAFIMGLWMTVAGFIEYWQAQKIHRLDPKALVILMRNQLCLGSMFVLLGLWWMLQYKMGWLSATDKHELKSAITVFSTVGMSAASANSLISTLAYSAYGSIVVFGILCQGWLSLYYSHRRGLLQAYLAQTPEWIISLQKHDTL